MIQLKKFEFSHHALERIKDRSTSKEEVIQAISESEWFRAEKNRYSCSKQFALIIATMVDFINGKT